MDDMSTQAQTIGKMDRFLYGFLFPLLAMTLGLFVIMNMPANNGAAEFAALGIFLIVITISPILLIVNISLAIGPAASKPACFKRGMIAPGIVMLGALLFQIGVWDAFF